MHPPRVGSRWLSQNELDAAILALGEESKVMELDETAHAAKIIQESLPIAALRLQQLTQADDPRIALQACRYLLDRGLGTLVPGGDFRTADDDVYAKFLAQCTTEYNTDIGNPDEM